MELTPEQLQLVQELAALCFSYEEIAEALGVSVECLHACDEAILMVKKTRALKNVEHWQKVDALASSGDVEMIILRNERLAKIKNDIL